MDDKVKKYISYMPSTRQKRIQREGFNAFIHYGLNTFTSTEWGNGKTSPLLFNPTNQNADLWCKTLSLAGANGVILTCKHHDGFCLWQTKTTDYSVASSPYKNGEGDIADEVSTACEKYRLKFGIYLSPWDRNSELYGVNPDGYNDFYCEQLKELLTGYGEVSFVWLDGACGSYMDGKPKQPYDFDRYYAIIRELAPNAAISNCGPDIRWVGNEGGYARVSEWNVVPKFSFDIQTIEKNSQQEDNSKFRKKGSDVVFGDLGSREFLKDYNDFMWYPAEVDVSIRPGWFYHKSQDGMVRSLKNLMNIYYNSVGGNSLLLLNIPPDTTGQFAKKDTQRLIELGLAIKSAFKTLAIVAKCDANESEEGYEIENVLTYAYDKDTYSPLTYYTPKEAKDSYEMTFTFDKSYKIDKVRLVENVDFSQRIENFTVYAICDGKEDIVYKGTTVGYNRVALFKKAYLADSIKIVIDSSRGKPYIEFIGAYETDGFIPKPPKLRAVVTAIHRLNYKVFIARENKSKE